MIWVIYMIIFLSLEWFLFRYINFYTHDIKELISFLSIHLLASVFISLAEVHFLLDEYKKDKNKVVWFLTFINFFVPILGVVFSLLFVFWGFRISLREQKRKDYKMIDDENILDGYPMTKRIFGEGSLNSILKSKTTSSSIKIKVLFMLDQIKNASSMDMIKKTLSDQNDEVRLVGFSIMDNNQKAMNHKINELLKMLKKSNDQKQKGNIYRDLAYSYWELIYQGLVDEQLIPHTQKEALEYLDKALEIFTEDEELYRLKGRIYFRSHMYKDAKDAFVKALDLGINQSKVASFMAEISFLERNFKRVPYWMEKISKYSLDYQLHNLSVVWRQK